MDKTITHPKASPSKCPSGSSSQNCRLHFTILMSLIRRVRSVWVAWTCKSKNVKAVVVVEVGWWRLTQTPKTCRTRYHTRHHWSPHPWRKTGRLSLAKPRFNTLQMRYRRSHPLHNLQGIKYQLVPSKTALITTTKSAHTNLSLALHNSAMNFNKS